MTPEEITQNLTDRGFALASTLVRDDFNGRDGSATWAITITRNGQSFQTEYTAGAAHRYYPKRCRIVPLKHRGKRIPYNHLSSARTTHEIERNKQSRPSEPELADVLCCIVWDAQSVMFGQTFEEFASDYGYDEDSRRAEKCYNACREAHYALIRLCGNEGLEELQELFIDY